MPLRVRVCSGEGRGLIVNGEDELAELFGKWDDARRRGDSISADDLCRDRPDLVEPLKLKIAAATSALTEKDVDPTACDSIVTGAVTQTYRATAAREPAGACEVQPVASLEPRPVADGLSPDEVSLEAVAAFTDLRFVAKGGLGAVYQATDEKLRRTVAVKFIQQKFADDEDHCGRLIREAEITGQLDHPGIVAVHGLGKSATGRLFYAMRYIKGVSLRERITQFHAQPISADEREFEFRTLLKHFVVVCETIAYAHNCGILHRDIKPENIMLGRFGETLVVDWGLAVTIDRSLKPAESAEETLIPGSGPTTSDSGGGTLPYMSPEQTIGDVSLGPASDVYGLGATLYHLLTGQAPFKGQRADVLERVRYGKFTKPRQLRSEIPKSLEDICLKAMRMDPAERYARASALARDVECWLADLPVSAHEEGALSRVLRWNRRHRGLVRAGMLAVTALAVVLVAATTVSVRYAREAEQARVETLRTTADFAKQTLGNELSLRFSVLQNVAQDPVLVEMLERQNAAIAAGNLATDTPLLASIRQTLDRHFQANQAKVPSSVWSLLTADGRQAALASVEAGRESPMKSFAYRDYFHGLSMDLEPGASQPPPLSRPHASCIFVNSTKGRLVTAFSVPVVRRNAEGTATTVGVLAMVVDCHTLTDSILGQSAGSRSAMTIELRHYPLATRAAQGSTSVDAEGLVIQHPGLTEAMINSGAGAPAFPRVDAATLGVLRSSDSGLLEIVDPIEAGEPRKAAFARVAVGDPGSTSEQHWAIIVRE